MAQILKFPDRGLDIRKVERIVWPSPFANTHTDINRRLAEVKAEYAREKPQPFNPYF